MSPDDLRRAGIELFGERGWMAALSSALGVERTQVWRYLNNRTPIPGPVAAAVDCWVRRFRETGKRPGHNEKAPMQ